MANKKITDVDVVSTVSDADYLFVNQGQSIKQIKKSDIPKPIYTAEEVGALPNTTIIPTALPNPNALTFTGAATGSYNGSSPVEINIPEGGGTGVTVDTTLSVAGQAADAKATGDAISSLSEEIANQGVLENGFLIIKNSKGEELFRVDLADLSGDIDQKGSISVDVTELTMNEGGTITFGVKLANKPTNDQIVNVSSSNSNVTVSPQELTFTNANYGEYQTVTVTSIDDEYIGDINGNITLSSNGVTSVIIALVVTDNDTITYYTMTASDGMTQSAQGKKWIRTYTGTEENVLIPSTMDDLPVNFDNGVYKFTTGTIKNLKFEDGIEYGGNFNVDSNDIKTILNVPSCLTSIDITAPNLKNITGLENCTELSKLEIKNTLLEKLPTHNSLDKLTNIGFRLNTNLTDESDFVIPPNVTTINQLFYGCTNLKKGPVIDRVITTIDHAFTNTALEELVYAEKENELNLLVIGYNESNGKLTGNLSANTVLFKVYSDSVMYQNLREKLAKNNVFFEKVSLGTIDDVGLTNVTFWGDSLTRITSNGYGDMCENFNSYFKDTVVSYNNGRAGATTTSAQTLFNAHPERYGDVTVLWLVTNDIPGAGVSVAINNLKEKYIPKLTNEKYIILGTLHFNYKKSDNEAMAQAFGEHFLNIHDYVLENGFDIVGKTPTQDELTSIANDTIPSFFVHTDGNHQNTYSGWVTSTAIKEKLLELGYISSNLLNDCGKVTSINLDKTNLAFTTDTNTQTLSATTTPSNATVTWISSDEAIATVNNGIVTPIANGTCYIIAKCGSYSKFCEVTVTLS